MTSAFRIHAASAGSVRMEKFMLMGEGPTLAPETDPQSEPLEINCDGNTSDKHSDASCTNELPLYSGEVA